MKNVLSLILALVICLSLCACSEGKPGDSEPTLGETLASDGEFTSPPVDETDPFIDSPSEPGIDSTEGIDLPVIGETKLMSMRERDDRPRVIELHENKSCTVDDKTYHWEVKIDSQYILGYYVAIIEGDAELYRVGFSNEPGITWVTAGENEYIYLDLSVYEKVELTVENWDTYFEMKDTFSVNKNAFGDFTSAERKIFYYLRESYFDQLYNKGGMPWDDQDDIAVEVQIAEQMANITVDVQNETHSVEPYGSIELRESVCTSSQESDYFRVHVVSPYLGAEESNHAYPVEITLLRVKGYLWLKMK